MLPNGLGDRGNDGGCSRGRAGAARLAPKFKSKVIKWLLNLDKIKIWK